jgi:hypothetical protein
MVGTVIHPGDRDTLLVKLFQHPAGQYPVVVLTVIAARDACLVGDDNETIAGMLYLPACLEHTLEEIKILYPMDVIHLPVDNAIAIQKNGWPRCHH